MKTEKALCTTPCIKNCYIWFKLKLVAFLQTSEFPLEIPRSQNRNFPYKTTLALIKKKLNWKLEKHTSTGLTMQQALAHSQAAIFNKRGTHANARRNQEKACGSAHRHRGRAHWHPPQHAVGDQGRADDKPVI